jgi:hypothetical protein
LAKSAAQGNTMAENNLRSLSKSMTPEQIDKAQQLAAK